MPMVRDHYVVLGVAAIASAAAIRKAYRTLALRLHPDRAGKDSAAAFRELAAAYEVLSDPTRRERYDAQLARDRLASAPSQMAPAPAGRKDHISRLSGALRTLLAAGLLRTIGEDAYEVWLTAEEAAAGGYIAINTSAPNQVQHWITVPSGVSEGTVLSSVLRVAGRESALRLKVRV
jgi:curved DNA-binding protein CbpA